LTQALERKEMADFEIYKDAELEFCLRFKANNGKVLAEFADWYYNRLIASMRLS